MKFVLVTGGVVSGLGKGVTASSIGVLLKNCGLRVTAIKIGTRCALKIAQLSHLLTCTHRSEPAHAPGCRPLLELRCWHHEPL
jgi:hypothetical protein